MHSPLVPEFAPQPCIFDAGVQENIKILPLPTTFINLIDWLIDWFYYSDIVYSIHIQ